MLMVSPERRADLHENISGMLNEGDSPEATAIHISGMPNEGDYLIALDDVWSDSEAKWRDVATVMKALPSNGRVVLTTRTPDIAARLATVVQIADTKPFYVQPLEKEFSPLFVAKWISTYHGDWPSELVTEAGMKIADKCSGVPLLLNYASRFFCEPQGMRFWQGFLENIDYRIDPDMFWRELLSCIDDLPRDKFLQRPLGHIPQHPAGNVVLESASASYQHLPSDLRGCFLYCSMFPSDYDFDVEELADLLAAGGYIPPIVAEAQRKGFLRQLLHECFYPMQQHEYGDRTAYRIHKVLHIFAQNMEWRFSSVMRPDQANQVSIETRAQSSIRRASLIVHPSTASFPRNLFLCKDLGALILLLERTKCPPEQLRSRITEIPQKEFRALHMELPSVKLVLWMNNKVLHGLKGALRGVAKNLEHISISVSEQLLTSSDSEGLKDLCKLTKLEICGCDELTCLPQGLKHFSSIRSLTIENCNKLETTRFGWRIYILFKSCVYHAVLCCITFLEVCNSALVSFCTSRIAPIYQNKRFPIAQHNNQM